MVHGGKEWSTRPVVEQERLYRGLVKAGADLVIGSHPHVLQGMESQDGRLIAYSLGNFLFPGMDGTPGGEDSVILKVGVVGGKIRYVRAAGVKLSGRTIRIDRTGEAARLLLRRTRELASQRG
jgi:poly-gamma-glutamate synthesis protein (capsule biosynthesis protein)